MKTKETSKDYQNDKQDGEGGVKSPMPTVIITKIKMS